MNKTTILGILGAIAVAFFVIVTLFAVGVSMFNTQAHLSTLYDAKVIDNKNVFDNMKKKITSSVQVSDLQMAKLKEIFTSYAQARTGQGAGDPVVSWVKESVPSVDAKIFDRVLSVITAARDEWQANQTRLIDISREYNQNLATFPGNVILPIFGFKHIDPKIVTSTATEAAFETGRDDDTKLQH